MRFNNIQLLRLGAAVGVVLLHLRGHAAALIGVDAAWLRYPVIDGFPVPLFFAVSGFVLAQAIRTISPGRFLFARFLRLYPGYWLALVGVVLLMRLRAYTEHHRWLIYFVNLTEVTLWPAGPGRCQYLLGGIEWSLVYEVFLSVALTGLSLFGTRRGVPILTAVWLVVLGVKMAAWPGQFFDIHPHWSTIGLSVHNVPFLLGVLVYQVKDRGRRWRWVGLPAVIGLLAIGPWYATRPEPNWCMWGVAAAGAVWLAVQFRQVKETHPLARLGDFTYGLFLFHVPLLMATFHAAVRAGWVGRVEVLWFTGAVAIGGGLLFGRLECAIYSRLRPLAKVKPADVTGWPGRVLCRLTTRPPVPR